ncbi:Benzoyl-CoA reductase/2-hydroxyglutaryl-CoA dehydratase subunit, BcrC/BadD/HgdB [Tindallia magadiensis]|uniref:Benzoyl-CoA reductase/2-hydroxyglutaryl-CoA dehydratase subunit, BcrC/BadD/HgdB n=1 Tax=Tindallia magadiensis TaxID=69895 RepID=A0A1I3EM09_9FIRM|nr:double-cubane-cluster-containing anaerobic reductase [Tindallia magadiensis]SFI00007.1 Benzoyl-CoA reductase/2-hydroxyglutaryl-CoA dehydratase subunit, BcrC/BadD/HgdB [Tindallia magadiensis]
MQQAELEVFQNLRGDNMIRIKDMKEEGKKVVGIYCAFCPSELVLAADAIPVSLCGTKEEPIPAAEKDLPRNLCPLIKSSYGFAITDTCPFFYYSDVIIGETTCDGKKKMFELMEDLKLVHVMQLPHRKNSDASMALWVEEIRELRKYLEEQLQVKITDDAIWEAIDLRNQERKAIKGICDLNKMDPAPLTGVELLTIVWAKGFSADKNSSIKMLTELKSSIMAEESDHKKLQRYKPRKPRVLLTGCPTGIGSEKVIRLVEELGASVVALENCSSYKTLDLLVSTVKEDPIEALAESYLKIPCSCMSPNEYRFELIDSMIQEFSADAVIDLTWQACHTYNIEAHYVEKLVKDKGLPYLHLESDYSNSDLEILKVRIEATLEMVK